MSRRFEFERDGAPVPASVSAVGGDHWRVRVGEREFEFRVAVLGDGGLRVQPVGAGAGPAFVAYGAAAGKGYQLRLAGRTVTLHAPAARRGGGAGGAGGDGTVLAPMTGTVLDVRCQPGDEVAADQTLVVLSAMKMEHKLTAGVAGTIRSVDAVAGGQVEQGSVLVVVEPAEATENSAATEGKAP